MTGAGLVSLALLTCWLRCGHGWEGADYEPSRRRWGAAAERESGSAEAVEHPEGSTEEGAENTRRFIAPGTRWCGAGNDARNFDHLGTFRNSDSCCREHDHCPDTIAPGETKHGLTNTGKYYRSSCACDDRFRQCLGNVHSFPANALKTVYFDFLRTQCFREDYAAVGCTKVASSITLKQSCVVYEFDMSYPRRYQWFDSIPVLIIE